MRFSVYALLALSTATGCFADDWNKTWSVSGTPDLHVETSDGRVEMHAGGGSQIEARVTTSGWKINSSEVRIIEHQSGNRVDLEVRLPKQHWTIGWTNHTVRIDLTVPATVVAEVRTGDGSMHIEGVRGELNVASGDGAIEIEGGDGKLHAHSGDGHINVHGRFDSLDVDTGDGSIEVELAPGSKLDTSWRLRTGDGHVTVRVPQDLRANLDAHTGDGSVTVDLPVTLEGIPSKSKNRVEGKVNGGGELLTITSGDGSIHIEKL